MTLSRIALAGLFFGLAACADATAPEDPDVQDPAALSNDAGDETAEAPAPVELDLSGNWTIADYNGASNLSTFPITVTFDGDRMVLTSRCLDYAFDLNRQGNIIQPALASDSVCQAGLTGGEESLFRDMPGFNILMERDGELRFNGQSGVLVLQRSGA